MKRDKSFDLFRIKSLHKNQKDNADNKEAQ